MAPRKGKKKAAFSVRRRVRKKPALSVGQGLGLIFGIAIFVALMATVVYYVWYLPVMKSLQ
jgi:hypothetical protein